MLRYVRAFWKALLLTLRGQQIESTPLRQPQIHAWMREGVKLVDAVRTAQERAGTTLEERKAFTLRIDKRDVALDTALQTIRHHLTTEYAYLLKNYTKHSVMTIQASNLNDQYLATRFAEADAVIGGVRTALVALRDHLAAIPPAEPDAEMERELDQETAGIERELRARAEGENAEIVVFNNTDTQGLAGQTRDWLASRGVSITNVGNVATPSNTPTLIRDYTGRVWTARYLAALLGLPPDRVQPGADGTTTADVMVVVGSDIDQVLSAASP